MPHSKQHTVPDSGLYGDEVQLVSIVGKESQSRGSRDGPFNEAGIYVSREVNVEVSKH